MTFDEGRSILEVLEFNEYNFLLSLSNRYCSIEEIQADFSQQNEKIHYLYNYLCNPEINVKTIVIERDYIDGNYLDDYSNYFVRCFTKYDHRCKRLHFFSDEIYSQDYFRNIVMHGLAKEELGLFKSRYKGFIVARPLPKVIIGRSCLATYSDNKGKRFYPCTRICKVNLFGLDLEIRSLEYQEQDTNLSACATIALWSSFYKCNDKFKTSILSPAAITRQANEFVYHSRPIPSNGLNVNQIHNAILKNGLVAELFPDPKQIQLVSLLYGYIRAELPIILGISIGDKKHAITLVGYSIDNDKALAPCDISESFIPFSASRIDKFFTHDDQIGPFARMKVNEDKKGPHKITFTGTWKTNKKDEDILVPNVVIIPMYHKIRVTFYDLHIWIKLFNWVFFRSFQNADKYPWEWDLFLTTTNELKDDARKTMQFENANLQQILFSQHPRFIWRALLKIGDKCFLELFADATEMKHAFPFYMIIFHDDELLEKIKNFITDPEQKERIEKGIKIPFYEFLTKNL